MARKRSIREQLRDAYISAHEGEDKLTLIQLAERARLDISESSLYRKLFEEQTLRSDEIEALAKALRIEVSTGTDRAA